MTIGVVAYGAVLAWRFHGRPMTAGAGAWMLVGAIVGTPAAMGVLGFAAMLLSKVPVGSPDSPPWLAIAVVALPIIGALGHSEAAEAGIFMVPFASAAIFAVQGADIITRIRERRGGGETAVHA